MSTKIYTGIKFKSNNIDEIINQLLSIKEQAKENFFNQIENHNLFLYLLQNNNIDLLKDYDGSTGMIFDIEKILRDAFNKEYKSYIDIGFKYEIAIFYMPKYNIYCGIYFNESCSKENMWDNLLIKNNIAEQFHYQNQTDKPDELSDQEWGYRKEVWDYCLPGWGYVRERGMIYYILSNSDFTFLDVKKLIEKTITHIETKEQ